MTDCLGPLSGRVILVVEDDFLIADAMRRGLIAEGAAVAGPVPSVEQALALISTTSHLDAAVLDVDLRGRTVYPVADALRERGVPFVFATGYDAAAMPASYRAVARLEKPVDPRAVSRALSG